MATVQRPSIPDQVETARLGRRPLDRRDGVPEGLRVVGLQAGPRPPAAVPAARHQEVARPVSLGLELPPLDPPRRHRLAWGQVLLGLKPRSLPVVSDGLTSSRHQRLRQEAA